ncbi:MAG: cytochrome c biogenesis CcdA family protein [Halanaerobium sp.]|nr:cytochrome c biogenesis CcdA family protein [Halanaerobium sp.]
MDNISYFLAFSAGILSFLSPCVLPLIPSYLIFLLGDYGQQKERKDSYTIMPSLLFILGFSIIFILLGVSASILGKFLIRNQMIIRRVIAILVIVLGIHQMGLFRVSFLEREKGMVLPGGLNHHLKAVLLGVGLSLAWTPCIGPILSSILLYAGNRGTALEGGLLLTVYSAGFALPFIITALSANWVLPKLKKLNRYLPAINIIAGLLIIIIGLLIFTGAVNITF